MSRSGARVALVLAFGSAAVPAMLPAPSPAGPRSAAPSPAAASLAAALREAAPPAAAGSTAEPSPAIRVDQVGYPAGAAVAAIAGRVYPPFDPAFAERSIAAARRAWAWLDEHPDVTFRNPRGVSTGEYGAVIPTASR